MDKIILLLKFSVALAIIGIYIKWRSRMGSSGQLISVINRLPEWTTNNKAKVLRYTRVVQAVTGLFLMLLGCYIGIEHFHLVTRGVRTWGTIVGYKEEIMSNGSEVRWQTAFMPIVKFQAGNRVIQFKDWMGANAAVLNVRVTVLYDPVNPSSAMIDRPVMNWIPWAPTFAVGLFLVLVAIKAWLSPPQSSPAAGSARIGVTGES